MSLGDEHITRAAALLNLHVPYGAYERWKADGNSRDADTLSAYDDALASLREAVAGAVGDVIPPRPTDDEIWEAAENEKWGGGEDWYPGFMAGFMAGFKAAAGRGLVLPEPPE